MCVEGHWRISDSWWDLLGEAMQVRDAPSILPSRGVPAKASMELAPCCCLISCSILFRSQSFSHRKAGDRGLRWEREPLDTLLSNRE